MIGMWNRALITGASSGIGRAIALKLAEDATDLVLVARDSVRLEELAQECRDSHGVEVEVLPADLVDRTQLNTVAERIGDQERPVDLLVNNAGLGFSGTFHELDLEGQTTTVDLNITALHRLSHAAAKTMAPRERGGIMNISSVAAYLVSPQSATYAASKAFVSSFSEALHEELSPFGVTVTTVCPGLTHTEFHERADIDPTAYPKVAWQTAEQVASEAIAALNSGKAKVITGKLNKAVVRGAKTVPSSVVRKLANTRKP